MLDLVSQVRIFAHDFPMQNIYYLIGRYLIDLFAIICRFEGTIFKSYLRKEHFTARKLHHHIQIHWLGVLEYADLRRSGHQQSASELEQERYQSVLLKHEKKRAR